MSGNPEGHRTLQVQGTRPCQTGSSERLHHSIAPITRGWQGFVIAFVCALLLVACTTLPLPADTNFRSGPRPTPLAFPAAGAAEAIPQLIVAERTAARTGDLGTLSQLWAADAQIIDGRGTPDPADDYVWSGRAAVLDRYIVAVFPNPPPPLDGMDGLAVAVEGDRATALHDEDRWRFVRRNGRWWIAELVYSSP